MISCFPRLGRGQIGVADLERLMAAPMIVMLTVLAQQFRELFQVLGGVSIQKPGQRGVTAFIFTLCLWVAELTGNAFTANTGQENFGVSDNALTHQIERATIIR